MDAKFSNRVRDVITFSREEALRLGHDFIGTEHLLLGMIREGEGTAVSMLRQLGVPLEDLREEIEQATRGAASNNVLNLSSIPLTRQSERVLKGTYLEAKKCKSFLIDTEHLLLSILLDPENLGTQILDRFDVGYSVIKELLDYKSGKVSAISAGQEARETGQGDTYANRPRVRKDRGRSNTPVLDNYGRNLTNLAAEGRLDPIVGREKEIERVAQVLSRRKKNNPTLIGEPGVGKTAIVEGLALRIIDKKVPVILFGKQVVSLDLASMVAGTKYRGQFEERVKALMSEIEKNSDVILFIDELHTIVGAGGASGSLDASNMFKPALSSGEIQCIGATTLNEYRQYIEKDGALARRFQMVMVEATSPEETLKILHNIKVKYEQHHKVVFDEAATSACVTLSDRYITDRFLPDKAIDVMDEAGARVHIKNLKIPKELLALEKKIEEVRKEKNLVVKRQRFEDAARLRDSEKKLLDKLDRVKVAWENETNSKSYSVHEGDISEVISMVTGIPVTRLLQSESKKLLGMKAEIGKSVIGQEEAIDKLVRAIQRNRVGLKEVGRPIGTFIFLGPTGVGKTELAKVLAAYLFGHSSALIRIDMSEYMEKFSVSRLLGAPPGYVGYEDGGQFTEKVRRKPYSVVLLDEIEKAHPDVFNVLLQVMDNGELTDGMGRKVSFSNTILILTSNIGVRSVEDFGAGIGFSSEFRRENRHQLIKSTIESALKRTFNPEFLNRLDDVIIFNSLEKEHIHRIIDISIGKLLARVFDLGYKVRLSRSSKAFLADKGYDPAYGVRPLDRAIQRHLEDPIAEELLKGYASPGDTFDVNHPRDSEGLTLNVLKAVEKA